MILLEFIFTSILFASWGGTFLALFVLIFQKFFENKLNIKLRYVLFCFVIVRLIFPIMPESSISVFNYIPHPFSFMDSLKISEKESAIPSTTPENGNKFALAEQTIALENSTHKNIQFNNIKNSDKNQNLLSSDYNFRKNIIFKFAASIWLLGVFAVFLSGVIFCFIFHKLNCKKCTQNTEIYNNISEYCKKTVGIKSNIKIKIAPNLHSPIITGLLSPTIYLPENLISKTSELELCYIIIHELVHWKRKDTVRNIISFLIVSIYWFNPIVWIIVRKIKETREMLCDIDVLKILGQEHTSFYGSTIIRIANLQCCKSTTRIYQTAFFNNKKQIKRRIMMLNNIQSGLGKKLTLSAIILSIALGTITMTNATGTGNLIANQYNKINHISNQDDFTLIRGNYQYFDSLERLSRYAGVDYLVPDILPKEFKVYNISLNKKNKSINDNNVIEIDFWYSNMDGKMVDGAIEKHFNFLICKDNLLNYLDKFDMPKNVENPDRTPKSKKIAGIDGYTLKTYNKLTSHTSDGKKIEGFVQNEYFIWRNNDIWYAVQFTEINKLDGEKPYSLLNLSENDITNIITSLKKPTDITNSGYILTDERPSYAVYDKYDLTRIKEDWGFEPVLPLELLNLKAKSADMSEVYLDNSKFGMFTVSYYIANDENKKTVAEYSQSTESIEYNLAVKSYLEQKGKVITEPLIPWKTMNINGKNVYYLVHNDSTHYVWNNGTLDTDINNEIEDLALLKYLV